MIYVTHDQIEAMTLADRVVVMNGGYIQQQGSPEELFKRPVNKFVAGFLGTPPMNFLSTNIEREGDSLYLCGNGFKILCDQATVNRLSQHDSAEVYLGIRPCDLVYTPDAPSNRAFDIDVVISEYIGAQSVLIGECGKQEIMVELKSDTPIALGERLRFSFQQSALHFFDVKTEAAI
jgi:multiple sugar transport system ATP-binding protein